jgi:hypothetical protein
MDPLSFGHNISGCLAASIVICWWDWQSNLSGPISISGQTTCAINAVQALGPSQAAGVNILGPARANITGLFGSGVIYGIRAQQGSYVKIDPTTSITGSAGDVLSSDAIFIPFAFLRSLVPKSIRDERDTVLIELP